MRRQASVAPPNKLGAEFNNSGTPTPGSRVSEAWKNSACIVLNAFSVVKVLSDQHYDMLRPTRSISDEDAINDVPAIVERPTPKFFEIVVSPPGEEPHMNEYRHVYPRPLRELDPSVTFLSATKINCYSHFTIYHHTAPISHETTYPTCQPAPAESNARYMYTTTLAPKFWPKLCSCQGKLFPNSKSVIQGADKVTRADPTQYSISQEIFREDGNQMLSSVVYHFVFASSPSSSTRSISPASVDDGCSIDYAPSVSGSVSEPFLHLDLSTGINFLLIIVKSWG